MTDTAVATADGAVADDGRDFSFFYEIIEAFRTCGKTAVGEDGEEADMGRMDVDAFLTAMTMFLRIFDAFANPFFADVVKRDIQGNIDKLRAAANERKARTQKEVSLGEVLTSELSTPGLEKLIRKESGKGGESGTVGLLWMKRMMQFVCGLLRELAEDSNISLSTASRNSYAKTLKFCHSFITRGVFDTGLRFVPARDVFYKNLAGSADVAKVDPALKEFLEIFAPQLQGIDQLFKARKLEPLIK